MAFNQFPYSNFHELNADWLLGVVKEAKELINTIRAELDGLHAADRSLQTEVTGLQRANEAINDRLDDIERTLSLHDISLSNIANTMDTLSTQVENALTDIFQINAAVGRLMSRTGDVEDMLADTYDPNGRYWRPSIVREDGKLWRCIVDQSIPTGATGQFDPSDWDEITVASELALLQTRFSALAGVVDELQQTVAEFDPQVYVLEKSISDSMTSFTVTADEAAELISKYDSGHVCLLRYNDRQCVPITMSFSSATSRSMLALVPSNFSSSNARQTFRMAFGPVNSAQQTTVSISNTAILLCSTTSSGDNNKLLQLRSSMSSGVTSWSTVTVAAMLANVFGSTNDNILSVVNGSWTARATKEALVVTFTHDASGTTCSHTYAKILSAYNTGRPIYAVIRDSVLPLNMDNAVMAHITANEFVFSWFSVAPSGQYGDWAWDSARIGFKSDGTITYETNSV